MTGARRDLEAPSGWLLGPAWAVLAAVAIGPLLGPALGALAAPVTLALASAWAVYMASRGSAGSGRWAMTLSDLLAVALPLAAIAWMLRSGDHDDPLCHHTFVALIDRWGLPAPSPGAPWRTAAYHTAADGLASALGMFVAWPPETRLDLVSVGCHGALGLAALAWLRGCGVAPVPRAMAVVTLLIGAGPYWLCHWLPQAQPAEFPWETSWEAGTVMSTLSLAGRRSAVIGAIGCLLAWLEVDRAQPGGRGWSRDGLGWGLLLAAQLQAADECVAFCLAAFALWCWSARPKIATATLALGCFVAGALTGGGFLWSWLSGATAGTVWSQSSSLSPSLALIAPQWPTFLGPNPAVFSVDGLSLALWEVLPGALGCLWLVTKAPMAPAARFTLLLWAAVGLIGATCLRAPRLGFDTDLHRLLQPAWSLGLAALPWMAWSLPSPWLRRLALVACAALWVGPLGRAIGAVGLEPVAVAVVVGSIVITAATTRQLGKPALAVCCLALVALAAWHGAPKDSDPLPPSAPAEAPAALEPLLTDATWGATALLQGAPIYAPWYRDDVEPLNADVHRIQLSLLTPADLQRAGVRRFWLTPESYLSLNRALGGILREEGRALSVARVDSWPNHGSAAKAAIVWGRVEVAP